jgi:hypothetical protein
LILLDLTPSITIISKAVTYKLHNCITQDRPGSDRVLGEIARIKEMDLQGSRKKRKRAFKEVNLKDRIRAEGMVTQLE